MPHKLKNNPLATMLTPKKRKPPKEESPEVTQKKKQPRTSAPTSTHKKRTMMVDHLEAKGASRQAFIRPDFVLLSRNEFGRYAHSNSRKIGSAVFKLNDAGELVATQYALPSTDTVDLETSEVCQLTQFQKIKRGHQLFYSAKGPRGESFFAQRTHKQVDELGRESEIAYFSEREDVDDNDEDELIEAVKRQLSTRKGGRTLTLDAASIAMREQQSSRGESQNKIMQRDGKAWSARNEYEDYFEKHKDKFSPELQDIFKRAFTANIHSHAESQYRPEWLHAYGFSLFPEDENPQTRENLGAAGKWVNTEMMILERLAKWVALSFGNHAEVKIKTLFDMLTDSEVIGKLQFEVSIEYQGFYTKFLQELYPFQESPVFHKPSDLAQAVGITQAQLQKQAPLAIEPVTYVEQPYTPRVWQDVPQMIEERTNGRTDLEVLTIIDLETTKLDYTTGKITEIGLISVYVHPEDGIVGLKNQYHGLADPHEPLSPEITKITGLTDDMLAGQSIDWEHVLRLLRETDHVVCHNSAFDRKYLESATPDFIQQQARQMRFGCTLNGIDWAKKGFLSKKLVDLNTKLKYRYTGHRALNDCWATINLLNQVPGALSELMADIHQDKILICATDTEYHQAASLRAQNFSYTNGEDGLLPKCWYKYVSTDELSLTKQWLDLAIYEEDGKSDTLLQINNIQAIDRYSERVCAPVYRLSRLAGQFGHFATSSSGAHAEELMTGVFESKEKFSPPR